MTDLRPASKTQHAQRCVQRSRLCPVRPPSTTAGPTGTEITRHSSSSHAFTTWDTTGASIDARLGCLSDTARTSTATHETSFGSFDDFCRFFPEAYRISCPGTDSSPWLLLERKTHEQVTALLGQ